MKERLDVLAVSAGLFETRTEAQRAIMAGIVLVNDEPVDKPGTKVKVESELRIKGKVMPYVSRGGLKLEKALDTFEIDVTGKIVMDVGASTGGFTDCALQRGAALVYAIDVGHNQLAWKLRDDARVISLEKTNFRYMDPALLAHGTPTFTCMDVSFISIKLLLPVVKALMVDGGDVVTLIKPQFEAGPDLVGKKGIVRDHAVHEQVIGNILTFVRKLGFACAGLTTSPITGSKGNVEFLLHLKFEGEDVVSEDIVKQVLLESKR